MVEKRTKNQKFSNLKRLLLPALFMFSFTTALSDPLTECVFNEFEMKIMGMYSQAEKVQKDLNAYLRKLPVNKYLDARDLSYRAQQIVEYVFENAVQHGSAELARGNYRNPSVRLWTKIDTDGSSVYVTIANPKLHEFPKSLRREFLVGESTAVPRQERLGFTGKGEAVGRIFTFLNRLPKGSSVKWDTDDSQVYFTLKIYYK
jgi:hypothetical protein